MMPITADTRLRQWLRTVRAIRGLLAKDAAAELGVSNARWTYWERGQVVPGDRHRETLATWGAVVGGPTSDQLLAWARADPLARLDFG